MSGYYYNIDLWSFYNIVFFLSIFFIIILFVVRVKKKIKEIVFLCLAVLLYFISGISLINGMQENRAEAITGFQNYVENVYHQEISESDASQLYRKENHISKTSDGTIVESKRLEDGSVILLDASTEKELPRK